MQQSAKSKWRGPRKVFVFDGKRLAGAIADADFTQADLAFEAGVNEATVSRAINEKNISWKSAGDICAALNRSMDELKTAPDQPAPTASPEEETVNPSSATRMSTLLDRQAAIIAELKTNRPIPSTVLRDILAIMGTKVADDELHTVEEKLRNQVGFLVTYLEVLIKRTTEHNAELIRLRRELKLIPPLSEAPRVCVSYGGSEWDGFYP